MIINKIINKLKILFNINNKYINYLWCYEFILINEKAKLPCHANLFSAGMDFYSIIEQELEPGIIYIFPTGLKINFFKHKSIKNDLNLLPYLLITNRSGLAKKGIITCGNGTIDCDYKGEIFIMLINHSKNNYKINIGDRIAQGIVNLIMPYQDNFMKKLINSNEYEIIDSNRGEKGFGSTGL
jgi:dUTP pyrophosphatase